MPGHPSVARRLACLSADQRAAATAPRGPVLCVAPAGSGKTTTLVARVAWLVDSGVAPGDLCALTFNRRAAEELTLRVDRAVADLAVAPGAIRIRTFHALGREILRSTGVDVERLADRAQILRQLLGERVTAATVRQCDDAFSRWKLDPAGGKAIGGAGATDDPRILALFTRYQKELKDQCALDFDDLIARPLVLLRDDDEIRTRWRAAARSLLVDEVQDLDRSQLELALCLAGPEADLFLVGDDDQTIYAWRLADVRRVLDLAARLPGLARHDLVTNRRCPPEVVRRASRLVAHNRERFVKRIEPSATAHGVVRMAADPGDEVCRARQLLRTWLGAEPGGHAVLARTNAALAPYAAVAVELEIPYRAADDGLVLDDPAIDQLITLAARLAEQSPAVPFLACLARAVRDAQQAPDALGRSVLAWAAAYPSADAFRDAVLAARVARSRLSASEADPHLTLATAHATKGLEWDHVACIGHDDGVFPSTRSIDQASDPDRALEEERRLAYVAWTRAKRSLTLVYDPDAPSIFMREAFDPSELADQRGPAPMRPRT